MTASKRILFATSNGTGLGHLNRAMAIARRLPKGYETSIFTLSQAAPVVARQGFDVDYLASYRRPASGTDLAWNLRLRAMLEHLLDERRPDLVVFDGVHPYRALTHVLSARGAPRSLWCRRPMWREGSSAAPLRREGAFDAVLEPGELAAAADRGPTVGLRGRAVMVDPIVYLDRSELLDRRAAARELGLDPDRRTALVSLGQGSEVNAAVARTLAALASKPDLQLVALRSSIASGLRVPDGVLLLEATFPMSRYFNAFDVAVAAAGYNAFHELLAFAVPTLLVPMARNTDDQLARARWAAEAGLALAVDGAEDEALEPQLERLCEPAVAAALALRCAEVSPGNGADRAADLVAALAADGGFAPSVRNRGRLNRWLRLSSHPVGPTLPLVLALGGRDLVRNPERRSPRLLVLALAVPPEELEHRLGRATRGEEPSRVLVITDSLDFAMLRRGGFAFELMPAASPGSRLSGTDLERLRRRVALLVGGRTPLRAVSIGEHGEDLIGVRSGPTGSPEAE